jgi:hypothetical protein
MVEQAIELGLGHGHHGLAAVHDPPQFLRPLQGSIERVNPAPDGGVVSWCVWKRSVIVHSQAVKGSTVVGVDVMFRPA